MLTAGDHTFFNELLFEAGIVPEHDAAEALWFIFSGRDVLVRHSEHLVSLPYGDESVLEGIVHTHRLYIGMLGNMPCYTAMMKDKEHLPEGYNLMSLRQLFSQLPENLFQLAGRAVQLLDWHVDHTYCGRCSSVMEMRDNDRSKVCPVCGLINFPRISPAIIVLISRGDEVLLTRSPHFKKDMYSVQAGFVEAGESLEDTVHREIWEEVHLRIKNLRYFGSQSWPFPNSLMTGFIAEYESGEVQIDGVEIEDYGWFRYNALPMIPDRVSISRALIDWFVEWRGTAEATL